MTYRSQPLRQLSAYPTNRALLRIAVLFFFGLVSLQLVNLTVVQHQRHLDQAQRNLYTYRRLPAPRGNIFDQNGIALATNHRVWTLSYTPWGQSTDRARDTLERLEAILGVPGDLERERILTTRPRWTRHNLVSYASREDILPVLERLRDFPGLRIAEDFRREYHTPTALAHITGYMSKIQPEEVELYTRPRYRPDDEVGRTGIERAFQDILAPHPGRERQERNARITYLNDPDVLERAEPGNNLYLTIHTHLQQRAMELLHGHEGSIILMDPHTGALLALASAPTFDPTQLARTDIDGQEVSFLNRAIRGQYPPGSPFKIIAAAAALKAGISPSHTHHCSGAFYIPGWDRPFHCGHRGGHGHVDLTRSIRGSCNIYYYETAARLGGNALREMAQAFGFGEQTGCDLPGEAQGSIPTLTELRPGELTNMSIGQGRMLATPLQVTRAFAALANGGNLPTPHIVRAIGLDPHTAEPISHPSRSVGLRPDQIAHINEGLFQVPNHPGGTAYRAGFPSHWQVAGKTGSVERGAGRTDAWFACFFPYNAPRYVLIVHLDGAGAGGDAAAPVARDFIRTILGEDPAEPESLAATSGPPIAP